MQPDPAPARSQPPYPPEPWQLRGTAYVGAWLVAAARLPEALRSVLPDATAPVRVAGRCVVVVGFLDYRPPGVLTYDELLWGVLVRHGLRPGFTIGGIWVDSAASLAGGRQLWAIPKELATFQRDEDAAGAHHVRAAADGAVLAELALHAPGSERRPEPTVRVASHLGQRLGGVQRWSPAVLQGSASPVAASWRMPRSGPLGFLADHDPFVTLAVARVRLRFGTAG